MQREPKTPDLLWSQAVSTSLKCKPSLSVHSWPDRCGIHTPKRQETWLKWPLNEAQASGLPHPRDQKPPLKCTTKGHIVLGVGQNSKHYDFRKQLSPLGALHRWAVLEIGVLGQDICFCFQDQGVFLKTKAMVQECDREQRLISY